MLSTRLLLWSAGDENVIFFDSNLEYWKANLIAHHGAAFFNIKLPTMPRARDHRSVQRSSAQRASGVHAHIRNRMELTVHVKNRDALTPDAHAGPFSGSQIGFL